MATKLGYDIHTLMAVLEGGDYSEMKLLSSGKNQRSQSTAGFSNTCEYTSEIKMLIESMNNVKADVINIKQTQLRKRLLNRQCFHQQFPKPYLTYAERIEYEKKSG